MRRVIVVLIAMALDVTFRTLVCEPIVEITRAVQAEEYGMVLAGTRGARKLEQFFVSGTAKRLIHKCLAAVWMVKAEHLVPLKVVVAATSFSDVRLKAVK